MKEGTTVSVVGLGYVGLPVAVEFARKFETIGFDISEKRIEELSRGLDRNGEIPEADLKQQRLTFTTEEKFLSRANFHIISVPTPIDSANQPELEPLLSASEVVGSILKKGDTVVYESTVYPGVTEEECLPVLENYSGLKGGKDFKIGYSPERINPGDTKHGFTQIKKVVSGQDEEALARVAEMYGLVVEAGIFKAESIKVAEAAKVIENTQRDLNISLMNELAIIFDRMGISTSAVLDAAKTKWNFLGFSPGLVGGHCIGVDPYYLTYKAQQLDYHPEVILAGRRINDGMGKFVAQKAIKAMIRSGHPVKGSRVSVMGFTFKEDVRDFRNTRVIDIVRELDEYGVRVQLCDPLVDPKQVRKEFGVNLYPLDDIPPAQAMIVAVGHREFKEMPMAKLKQLLVEKSVLLDVKGIFRKNDLEAEGIQYWRV